MKTHTHTHTRECLGLYEVKQYKPWFYEEFLRFLNQRKQAKLQWLQDPNQRTVENPHSVRRESSRNFRNKKKEYMKAKQGISLCPKRTKFYLKSCYHV